MTKCNRDKVVVAYGSWVCPCGHREPISTFTRAIARADRHCAAHLIGATA